MFLLLKLLDLDTLHALPRSVVAAGHESPGEAAVWLAGLPGSVSTLTDFLRGSPLAVDTTDTACSKCDVGPRFRPQKGLQLKQWHDHFRASDV